MAHSLAPGLSRIASLVSTADGDSSSRAEGSVRGQIHVEIAGELSHFLGELCHTAATAVATLAPDIGPRFALDLGASRSSGLPQHLQAGRVAEIPHGSQTVSQLLCWGP